MDSSVVIATFNGERFIEEQLDSIIRQTVLPGEIILSDDGSTDHTQEIIQSFIDRHSELPITFKFILNETGEHGVLSNFENAVRHATGDYLFFCDQDDIWCEDKIFRMMAVLKNTDAKVAIHNARVILENTDGTFSLSNEYLMGSYPFSNAGTYRIDGTKGVWSAFYYCLIQGMCICAERNYIQSLLPFSRGSNHDNWILFCAQADDTLIAVQDVLSFYRIHQNNTCGISKYKKKRSLRAKLLSFNDKGEQSVKNQYLWYTDTSAYLQGRTIENDQVRAMARFFMKDRIDALKCGRIAGTIRLLSAYRSGVYQIDGSILLFHDLQLVWTHSRKNRIRFISNLDSALRKTGSAHEHAKRQVKEA